MIAARAALARAALDALPPAQLGDMVLRPDQRRIIARAQRSLETEGGCLIGEDVGRGKTFIALALARQWRRPLVVAPAALRSTWLAAQARAGVECAVISHESLSRRSTLRLPFTALIVDESHHFRNPATIRYAELARMAASVPVVLLSATPLQNRPRDLAAQLALFQGESAFALDAASLARSIIRGDANSSADMPAIAPPEWLPVGADDGAVLSTLLDLPPPVRALDGGDAGALRTIALVRAWTSSRAALKATLRSRRRMAAAIAQGIEAGRTPTRRETRAWRSAEDVVQLGFAAVLMQHSVNTESVDEVRRRLEDDDAAYQNVRAALLESPDPDRARVAVIRALRRAHRDCRIIAFSEYASTVSAYFDALRSDAGVGMLTARGAKIATGRIARAELLARFAPRAQGAGACAAHDAVTLLLTTDILSEGVNLQDASIVLHLDLPWNPARIAQRVGRLRRPGGAELVRSFLLAPPARADALLAAEARLRQKMEHARGVVGPSFDILPKLRETADVGGVAHPAHSSATATGHLVESLEQWAREPPCEITATAPPNGCKAASGMVVGAVAHALGGWIAALGDGRIVAARGGEPTESPDVLIELVTACQGNPRHHDEAELSAALASLQSWIDARKLLDVCGVSGEVGPICRAATDRLSSIVRQAHRHEQPRLLALVSSVRYQLSQPMPLGAQRTLFRDLTRAATCTGSAVEALTSAVRDMNESRVARGVVDRAASVTVAAVILVGPDRARYE